MGTTSTRNSAASPGRSNRLVSFVLLMLAVAVAILLMILRYWRA